MTTTANQGRGVLILVLGILSIVVCAVLGPVAWVMGSGDLKKIQAGEIAQEAQGLTQAGKICGIIGTVILALSVLVSLIVLLLGAIGIGAGTAVGSG